MKNRDKSKLKNIDVNSILSLSSDPNFMDPENPLFKNPENRTRIDLGHGRENGQKVMFSKKDKDGKKKWKEMWKKWNKSGVDTLVIIANIPRFKTSKSGLSDPRIRTTPGGKNVGKQVT